MTALVVLYMINQLLLPGETHRDGGKPSASAMTTKRIAAFGMLKNGKTCVVS
jgi:hypothetical protein